MELVVPAELRYLAAARVVAATLAADVGFDLDDLDRLRVGVNELLTIMIEATSPGERIRLKLHSEDGGEESTALIEVAGTIGEGAVPTATPLIDTLAERILDAVTDEYHLDEQGFAIRVVAAGNPPIRERPALA